MDKEIFDKRSPASDGFIRRDKHNMENLNSIMIEALEHYDEMNIKYKKYIKNKNYNKNRKDTTIIFNNTKTGVFPAAPLPLLPLTLLAPK